MDESLERFLAEVRERLRHLPAPEGERRYDAVCRELEQGIASELDRGRGEEDAAAFAISQLDLAHYTAPLPPPRSLRQRLDALPPVVVAALYCAVAHTVIYAFFTALVGLVASTLFAGAMDVDLCRPFSLTAAVVGIVLLLVRDGLRPALRNVLAPDSLIGAGIQWITLSRCLSTVIWLGLLLLARSVLPPDFLTGPGDSLPLFVAALLLLGFALAVAAPFVAGWLIARRTGTRQSFEGVRIAALTGLLLTIADLLAGVFSGGSGEIGQAIFVLFALTAASYIYNGLGIAGAYFGSFEKVTRE